LDSVKNEGSKLIQVVHSPKEMKFYSFKAITDMVIWLKGNSPLWKLNPRCPTCRQTQCQLYYHGQCSGAPQFIGLLK